MKKSIYKIKKRQWKKNMKKILKTGIKCKNCKKIMGKFAKYCIYCGNEMPITLNVTPDIFEDFSIFLSSPYVFDQCNEIGHALRIFLFEKFEKAKTAYCANCGIKLF